MTLREVNWNDADFTTVLLLWEQSEGCERGMRRVYGSEEARRQGRQGGGQQYKTAAADSQLTDLVGHFLQFVLRATHDDHIQPLSGQLEMKQLSNHVCN